MLLFTRKKLSGSYVAFTSARRREVAPERAVHARVRRLVGEPREVQVHARRCRTAHVLPGRAHPARRWPRCRRGPPTSRRSRPCTASERSENAVSSGPTSSIAPPMWNVLTSVSGAGRSLRLRRDHVDRLVGELVEVLRLPVGLQRVAREQRVECRSAPPTNGVGPDMSNSDGAQLAERLHHLEPLLDVAGVDAADDRHGPVVHRLRHLGVGRERDRDAHRRDLVGRLRRRNRASRAGRRPTSSIGYMRRRERRPSGRAGAART